MTQLGFSSEPLFPIHIIFIYYSRFFFSFMFISVRGWALQRGEVFIGFWLGGPKVRDHWEDLGVGKRIT